MAEPPCPFNTGAARHLPPARQIIGVPPQPDHRRRADRPPCRTCARARWRSCSAPSRRPAARARCAPPGQGSAPAARRAKRPPDRPGSRTAKPRHPSPRPSCRARPANDQPPAACVLPGWAWIKVRIAESWIAQGGRRAEKSSASDLTGSFVPTRKNRLPSPYDAACPLTRSSRSSRSSTIHEIHRREAAICLQFPRNGKRRPVMP